MTSDMSLISISVSDLNLILREYIKSLIPFHLHSIKLVSHSSEIRDVSREAVILFYMYYTLYLLYKNLNSFMKYHEMGKDVDFLFMYYIENDEFEVFL